MADYYGSCSTFWEEMYRCSHIPDRMIVYADDIGDWCISSTNTEYGIPIDWVIHVADEEELARQSRREYLQFLRNIVETVYTAGAFQGYHHERYFQTHRPRKSVTAFDYDCEQTHFIEYLRSCRKLWIDSRHWPARPEGLLVAGHSGQWVATPANDSGGIGLEWVLCCDTLDDVVNCALTAFVEYLETACESAS